MSVLLCKGQRDRLKLGRIATDVEPRKLEEPVRERLDLPLLGADRPQIARAGCLILRDAAPSSASTAAVSSGITSIAILEWASRFRIVIGQTPPT